jgi:hypothetical protein
MKVLIKPKVTKPWSMEMYEYNDKVAELMKDEIQHQLESSYSSKNKKKINELVTLCCGIKFGSGYDIDAMYESCLEEITMVQNYWLNDEWDYAVKQNVVRDVVPYKFVGYGK